MNREWNLLGFLDDDPEKQGTKINGIPVLGGTTDIDKYSSCRFIVLLGTHKDRFIKKRTIAKLPIPAENYATVIHPTAWISRHAIIGRGSILLPGITIMANAEIGNHVFIASKTNIGHDTKINDYVLMSALVAIAGNVV